MSYAYGPYIKGDISSLSEIAISSPKLKKVGTYIFHYAKKISNSEKNPQNKEKDESQYMMVKVINWQINRIAAA